VSGVDRDEAVTKKLGPELRKHIFQPVGPNGMDRPPIITILNRKRDEPV
jgi:hypothetical protein